MGVWTPAAPIRQQNIFVLLTILAVSSVTQFNLNFATAQQNQNPTQGNLTFLNTSEDHPLPLDSNISSRFRPPKKWQEKWKSTDKDPQRKHNKELTRVYFDSNIAFYFDPEVDQNITWPFQIVSEAWDYAKRTYGPFGPVPNPLLYIILHEEEHVGFPLTSRTSNYTDVNFHNRHVIDCGRAPRSGSGSGSGNSWTIPNNSVNLDQILIEMGTIIQKTARETGNWPGWAVSEFKMSEILLYDIYLKTNRTEDADRVKKERLTTFWDIPQPRKAIYWFRDWYLPIYEDYGGATALNSIFTQLYSDWERNNHNYVADMNDGEFVHFWSGAVGDNLEYLAIQTLGWSLLDRKELQDARIKFPNFNYSYNGNDKSNSNLTRRRQVIRETWKENWYDHKEVLTRVYVNKYVAFYVDNSVDRGVKWPFSHLSSAWEYVQGTYGSFGSDPLLYVNLHQGKHYNCITSRENSFADPQFGDRNVIDCGDYADVWKTETENGLKNLVAPLGLLVQRGARARGNFTGVQIANCEISDIIVFDIFLNGLKDRTGIAKSWLEQKIKEKINFPRENTAWFKDWFFSIYISYEGATVLNNFLKLLSENWLTKETVTGTGTTEGNNGRDYLHQMNIGEFVHFWSGAAGRSLRHLANQTFDWNDEYEAQFRKAQEMYSNVTYVTFNDSNSAQTKLQPIILYEQWNGCNEIVYRVNTDKLVTIYYDKSVNRSIVWPFELASEAWLHVTSSYKVVQEQPLLSTTIIGTGAGAGDRDVQYDYDATTTNQKSHHLYVILHAGTVQVNQTASSKSPLYNFRNVINCGKSSSKAWEKNEANSDFLMIQVAQVIHKSVSQNTNGTEVKYDDLAPMSDIIVYDIYFKSGRVEDASRWLNHTMKGRKVQAFGGVKFWMQDWYYPIYNDSQWGSGGTGVLDKFLFILNKNKARIGNKDLSIGECVHFWSVAAGKSLFKLAISVFPSTKEFRDSFNKAQVDFPQPQFSYECYDCKDEDARPFPVLPISVSIFLALGVVLGVPLSIYIHKLRQKIQVLTNEEVRQFFEGDVGDNTDNSSSPHDIEIEVTSVTGPDELYALVKSMPFNRQYELPRHQLVILNPEIILGSGEFGVVLKGCIKRKGSNEEDVIVAVKTVKPELDIIYFKALLSELKILGYLGRHENIASLLGSFTDNIKNREVYVALEFCENGDLLQFLRGNSNQFQDLLTAKKRSFRRTISFTSPPSSRLSATSLNSGKRNSLQSTYVTLPDQFLLTTVDLVELSRQISNGMKYISSRNIIHGDLAARNILITRNNVAKISDFGLSRQLVNYSHYTKQSKVPLPWRWMAIESLRNMKFSIQSDMWGFGVILYEIFTLGATPYAGWTWDYEFVDKLTAGHRLASPEFCNAEIYSLMKACWLTEPSSRISFTEMTERLQSIKVQLDPKADEVVYVDVRATT